MNPYYNESAFLQDLAILVNTDSGTGTVEGIDKIANFMMKKYADLGMWTEKKTFRADLGPCVEARNHPKSREIDLLLIGHMDTVFPVGTAAERPLTVDGNRVLGPGAADMKSGTLLCTCLAAFVQAERPELKLCIAHNCDEEIGSPSSDAWIRELALMPPTALIWNPDAATAATSRRARVSAVSASSCMVNLPMRASIRMTAPAPWSSWQSGSAALPTLRAGITATV